MVSFTPINVGRVTAQLLVSSNARNAMVPITLSGEGAAPHLIPSRAEIDFGTLTIGKSASQVVVLAFSGNAVFPIDSVSIDPSSLEFGLQYEEGSIPAGGTKLVTVNFAPIYGGAKEAKLIITSGDTTTEIPLRGIGYQPDVVGVFAQIPPKATNVVLTGISDPLNIKNPGSMITVQISESPNKTAAIILDGSPSMEINKKALQYNWNIRNSSGSFELKPQGQLLGVTLPVGSYTASLIASNGTTSSDPVSQDFTVSKVNLNIPSANAVYLNGVPGSSKSYSNGVLTVSFSAASVAATLKAGPVKLSLTGAITGAKTINVVNQ